MRPPGGGRRRTRRGRDRADTRPPGVGSPSGVSEGRGVARRSGIAAGPRGGCYGRRGRVVRPGRGGRSAPSPGDGPDPVFDHVRLVEILFGPEAAMSLLREARAQR